MLQSNNGMVRKYFPKGTDVRLMKDAKIRSLETRPARRPRKEPGCRFTEEAFASAQALCPD